MVAEKALRQSALLAALPDEARAIGERLAVAPQTLVELVHGVGLGHERNKPLNTPFVSIVSFYWKHYNWNVSVIVKKEKG